MEDQLSRLREYEEAIYQFKPHLEELERINQQIQESFVFENRYTQYTMETLRVGWEQLVTSGIYSFLTANFTTAVIGIPSYEVREVKEI